MNANNGEDDGDVRTIPEDVPALAEDTEESDVVLANAVEPTDALPVHPRALWADLVLPQPPVTVLVHYSLPRRLTRTEGRTNRPRSRVAGGAASQS